METPSSTTCNHLIHGLLVHFPKIHEAKCKKIIFYKRLVESRVIRMCCSCHRLSRLRGQASLTVCHWITSGNLNFAACEFCNTTLETTRSIFNCSECVYTYLERAIIERKRGRNINDINAFAYCRTHNQGQIS